MAWRIVLIAGIVFLALGGGIAAVSFTMAHNDSGCGDQPGMGAGDRSSPYDLLFIDEMITHHQGAIMSAGMMIEDSERPELRDLAQRIQESQQRQIDQMRVWRAEWYPEAEAAAMDVDSMAKMAEDMESGMMSGGMMRGMMGGDQSDQMFLRMMIPHHQVAVDMSKVALQQAEHEDLKGLAEQIIEGQSAEIEEMERYLQQWYGSTSDRDAFSGMHHMMRQVMRGC